MTCPDDDTVVDLLEGRLDEVARAELLRHLDACDACRHLVADAGAFADDDAATAPGAGDPEARLGRGASIGRYLVNRVLGVGAMGVVYAAHDPQLGRDVAVKLLRREAQGDRTAAEARAVMLREAQTLARLSHPNVIAIHDADVFEDHVFLVMELVEGRTLREWLAQAPRDWRALRDVFVQAGRGLEAAHAEGLVHRDFKPDNVLVGRDGRVRVTDFGLARWNTPGPRPSAAAIARGALRSSTTMAGTPAYMSPEQLAGLPVDARSDLFGFCVALYEAIYGARPFDGRVFEPPGDAPAALPPVTAPPKRGVPARARRALERGLAADREARPASMHALLAELDHRPAITAPRVATAAVALAAIGAAVIAWRGRTPAATCDGADAAWGAIWDPVQQARVRAAFVKSGKAAAADAFAETDHAMTALRGRWIALHGDACRKNRDGDQSADVLDRRMACLTARRREAADLADGLIDAIAGDPDAIAEAPGRVHRLSPLDDCADARPAAQASTTIRPVRAPVAVRDRDGHLEVFVIGAGGRPWWIAETDTGGARAWGAWTPLGDHLDARSLVTATERDGRLVVLAIDRAGAISGVFQTSSGWDGAHWGRIGSGDAAQLSIADDGTGRHHLFAIERDAAGHDKLDHLAQAAPNSGWATWDTWTDDHAQQVVAVNDESAVGGRVHVFFLKDQQVFHAWHGGGDSWSSYSPMPSDPPLRQIDAGVNLDGRLELVGLDATGRAMHDWVKTAGADATDGTSWSGWQPLGTPEQIATIHLVRNRGDGHLEAFGVTPNGRLLHLYQAGRPLAWNGWWEDLPLAPSMKAIEDVALALDGDGKLYIFAQTASGELWMLWQAAPASGPLHGWLLL